MPVPKEVAATGDVPKRMLMKSACPTGDLDRGNLLTGRYSKNVRLKVWMQTSTVLKIFAETLPRSGERTSHGRIQTSLIVDENHLSSKNPPKKMNAAMGEAQNLGSPRPRASPHPPSMNNIGYSIRKSAAVSPKQRTTNHNAAPTRQYLANSDMGGPASSAGWVERKMPVPMAPPIAIKLI